MIKKIVTASVVCILVLFASISVKADVFTDNQVVAANKSWTIHFSHEVSFDDLSKQGITVLDGSGNKVDIGLNLGDDNKTIIVNPPTGGYEAGSTYKLIVGSKVHSRKNKNINHQSVVNFSIEKDNGDEIVVFKDANLEKDVRDNINKPTGSLYKSDVEKITDLEIEDNKITDLRGIEKLSNLTTLKFFASPIKDITPLEKLTKLKSLTLQNAKIDNINALKGLNALNILNLSGNKEITDISCLKELTNLIGLKLDNNKISDIDALKGLTNLSWLQLNNNQITNISALEKLTKISSLELENNKIIDISALQGLSGLSWLKLRNNQIKNIDSLKELTNLKSLIDLGNNQIMDISALQKLTKLQSLVLDMNQISDISSLKELTKLQSLNLDNNKITNIDSLQEFYDLKSLNLGHNEITDVSALKGLHSLQSLDLNSNQIVYVNALKELTDLESLALDNNNQITDLSVLQGLTKCYISAYSVRGLNKCIEVSNKVDEIMKSIIKPNMSDLEKEKAIHDYIVLNTKYDYDNYLKKTIPNDDYCPYNILIKGTGVCEGYAETTQLLLSRAGIKAIVVIGQANNGTWGGHAWNIVQIDGKYYQLDTTWDDPVPDRAGYARYEYFNINDSQMAKDHRWDNSQYPACN